MLIRLIREEKTMVKAERPFLIVNPKSYLYGAESLELAKSVDKTAAETYALSHSIR